MIAKIGKLDEMLDTIAEKALEKTIITEKEEQAFYIGIAYLAAELAGQLEDGIIKLNLNYETVKQSYNDAIKFVKKLKEDE